MNKVFINNVEITNFDNDNDTIEFVEKVLNHKTDFVYNDDEDSLSFELDGQGIVDVDSSDLSEYGKLTIFK